MQASITSPRLCGGMLVAMPTAMPPAPLTSRFGNAPAAPSAPLGAVVVVAGNRRCPCRDRRAAHCATLARRHFGVAHGRRRIAVDRAEIALAVDQRQAHARSPAPCAPARRRSRGRRAGDTYPSRRRRRGPTCMYWLVPVVARSRAWRRGCAGARASGRRARRAARGSRSRSWRNRDRSASSRR